MSGISNIYPLWVVFFTILFGTEVLTYITVLAALIIVGGVFLIIISPQNTEPNQRTNRSTSRLMEITRKQYMDAVMLAALAAVMWGFGIFGLGFSLKHFTPLSANAIRMISVGAILLMPYLILPPVKNRTEWPSKNSLILIGITSIVVIGIGGWLMLVSIDLLGAAKSSAIIASSPFFAAIIAIFMFKEIPTLRQFFGIFLVIIGIVLISSS